MGFDAALFNQDDKHVYKPEGVELAFKVESIGLFNFLYVTKLSRSNNGTTAGYNNYRFVRSISLVGTKIFVNCHGSKVFLNDELILVDVRKANFEYHMKVNCSYL